MCAQAVAEACGEGLKKTVQGFAEAIICAQGVDALDIDSPKHVCDAERAV